MNLMDPAILITLATVIVTAAAEVVHGLRVKRVMPLLPNVPRAMPFIAGVIRVVALGALAWSLTTLYNLEPKAHRAEMETIEVKDREHILLVLDVSPSMRLQDAGEEGDDSRTHRASSLIKSLLKRVSDEKMHFTVIATYTSAKPVVKESRDREVLLNILDDLPMHYAFESGKTRLFDGLEEAAVIAKEWRNNCATLVVISDGDTVPPTGMPHMPPSVGGVLVVGVGDPMKGSFIDGRQSRQDVSTLREIANRMGGEYHDGNIKHVPTATLRSLGSLKVGTEEEELTIREYALITISVSSFLVASLPFFLYLINHSNARSTADYNSPKLSPEINPS